MFEDFLSANNMHACQDALVYLRFNLPRNPCALQNPWENLPRYPVSDHEHGFCQQSRHPPAAMHWIAGPQM
jgi:hypothetical protein